MIFEYEKPSMKFYDFQVDEIMVGGEDGLQGQAEGDPTNLPSVIINGPGHNNGEADPGIW